jgi:hypothetical protein
MAAATSSPVSDSNNFKALKHLKLSKFVGYNMPGFGIKGFSNIYVPVLTHTIFLI